MIRPCDVAHVNLNVTDLNRAIRFYTQILGFKIAFQYEDAVVWLNFGQYRDDVGGLGQGFHDVALFKVANPAPEDRRRRAGMNHMALRLRAPEEVVPGCRISSLQRRQGSQGPLDSQGRPGPI